MVLEFMNESTQKTPGQILHETFPIAKEVSWGELSARDKTQRELSAQAIISAHKPRITAEDVRKEEEVHQLACLAEECCEVIKEVCKSLRFGLDDKVTRDPKGPRGTEGPTNRQKITSELNDILGVVRMLVSEGTLPIQWDDPSAQIAKGEKIKAYMDYARSVGHLSHQSPDGGEGGWEYANGKEAKEWGWNPSEGEWRNPGGKWVGAGVSTWSFGCVDQFFRRPRQAKEESQPQDQQRGAFTIRKHAPYSETRERLGKLVREVWIAWAKEQPTPKESWLKPWEGLSEPDKEVDRRIGETLYNLERPLQKTLAQDMESQPRGGQEMQPVSDTVIISRSERDQLRVDLSNAREEIIRLEQQMEISEHVTKTASAHLRAQLRQTQGGRLTWKELFDIMGEEVVGTFHGKIGLLSDSGIEKWKKAVERINSRLITSPWTAIAGPETLPTKEDGDRNGNVLVIFPKGFIQYIGWKEAATTGRGVAWMTPPPLSTPEPEQVDEEDPFEKWWKPRHNPPEQMSTETPHQPKRTPRTNEAAVQIRKTPEGGDGLDWISFARTLETELNEAQSQLKEALEKGERLEEENDELCAKIKSHEDWIKGPPSTGSSNWSALAEKEGGKP